MTTIAGPKVQVPSSLSNMYLESGQLNMDWQSYFSIVQQIVYNVSRSGPTLSRPTETLSGRYIGMPYFDTDLGLTVYLKHASSNAWVKGDGSPA